MATIFGKPLSKKDLKQLQAESPKTLSGNPLSPHYLPENDEEISADTPEINTYLSETRAEALESSKDISMPLPAYSSPAPSPNEASVLDEAIYQGDNPFSSRLGHRTGETFLNTPQENSGQFAYEQLLGAAKTENQRFRIDPGQMKILKELKAFFSGLGLNNEHITILEAIVFTTAKVQATPFTKKTLEGANQYLIELLKSYDQNSPVAPNFNSYVRHALKTLKEDASTYSRSRRQKLLQGQFTTIEKLLESRITPLKKSSKTELEPAPSTPRTPPATCVIDGGLIHAANRKANEADGLARNLDQILGLKNK